MDSSATTTTTTTTAAAVNPLGIFEIILLAYRMSDL